MRLTTYITLFIIIFQISGAFAQSKVLSIPSNKQNDAPTLEDIEEFVEKAEPEANTGFSPVDAEKAKDFMIVTANPIATQAGYDILSRGGSAADAAFAAQLVLGLVEPQSSGLGGGGFALYWNAEDRKLTTYDGRETAPESVTEDIFLKNGRPMDFQDAVIGGRAVGIPGLPALLDQLYEDHGTMPRNEIFQPAFELSKYGFIASPRLAEMVQKNKEQVRFFKSAKDYFLPNGQPIKANQNITNSDYNNVLFDFQSKGAEIFYTGEIAEDIMKAVNEAWHNPGQMTLGDFSSYKVIMRDPVCGTYRKYKVCSMGEPSSGGLTLVQILQMLERFDLSQYDPDSPNPWHLIVEASRLAFADRNFYMADPDKVETPGLELVNLSYTAVRSSMIQEEGILQDVKPGKLIGWPSNDNQTPDEKQKNTGTTHISVIDKYGNALSLTSSIETAFGAKMMVDGFLLNNQLTDFFFRPEIDGKIVANRAEGGKRPRSSMTPVIIFDENDNPVMILGSAGGSRIIGYVLQRIIAVLDWGLSVDQALEMPHILSRGQGVEIENIDKRERKLETAEYDLEQLSTLLEALGHDVETREMNSGLTILHHVNDTWRGAADPRREGVAMGE